jgi:hypothetical protein
MVNNSAIPRLVIFNLGNPFMKDEIEQALNVIIGLPIWSIGRAGNLEWFEIGTQPRLVQDRKGSPKTVSEYALHVQCAWRICHQGHIIAGSHDRLYPPGEDFYANIEDFDWDTPGGNRLDRRVDSLLEEKSGAPLEILGLQADNMGGVYFRLSDGYSLEIFPDDSLPIEHWRFFQPYTNKEHFIATGHGVEYE